MKKLAIVTTHPIQYNAPWFRLLAQNGKVEIMVFYTWSQLQTEQKFDPGFGKSIKWDIPLLEGYPYTFVQNTSTVPGSHHRKGIVNPTLCREIQQWQADAVLVFGWNFVSHFQCIRYFHKKIPVLFRGDSTFLRKQSPIKSFVRLAYLRWVYSFVDYALYVGTENKKYYLKCGLKQKQLVYAPHAVENDRFKDRDDEYQTKAVKWRRQLGIEDDCLTVLYAGKLEKIKNPSLFIDFAKRFQNTKLHFILAGNGPLENDLKQQAAGLTQVSFIDFQNQLAMPVVYRLADFFMLASESETWGLAVNEAMACGKAVLVRNTCGCVADLVKNGQNGFVFDIANMDTFYQHINELVPQKKEWKKMGTFSEKIIQSYTFTSIVSAIENMTVLK